MTDSIPVLPRGVIPHEDSLEDKALLQSYPMNATALSFLSLIDGKRSLKSINALLAQHYQQPEETIQQDTLSLSQQLQRHGLLNLRETWRQFFLRCLMALRLRTRPALYTWRFDPPATSNMGQLFLWMFLVAVRAWLPLCCPGFIGMVIAGAALSMVPAFAGWYLFICICLLLSIALHETGHLIMLRRYCGREAGFVLRVGPLLQIVRPSLNSLKAEVWVSLVGPLVPTVVALLLLLWHFVHGSLIDWIPITLFGLHALQLILPNRDLSNIFHMVRLSRR